MAAIAQRKRSRARTLGISFLVVVIIVLGAGGVLLFGWMADETHFDRPSAEFDALDTRIAAVPGVVAVEKERWVEAPTFADPSSSIRVTLDRSALPMVLDIACEPDYPDPVDWGLVVRTPARAEVSIFAAPVASVSAPGCPDFGLDATATIDALDDVAPGRSVQATVWENGRLSFSDVLDGRVDIAAMLPLVAAADELRRAAGAPAETEVAIDGPTLGAVVAPGEAVDYAALLRTLVEDHGVTNFWDGIGGGVSPDEAVTIRVTVDPSHADAVEAAIRSSGLRLADAPVVFRDE